MSTTDKWCGCKQRAHLILFSFFIVGLFAKYLIFIKDGAISRDGARIIYDSLIWNQTGNFSAIVDNFKFYHTPPLYHFILKQFIYLTIDPFLGGISINIFFGNMLIITTFMIFKNLFRKNSIALFSAFLTLIHPTINQLSVEIQRDIPYLFLSSLVILLFVKAWITQKTQFWLLSGGLIGLTFLIRYEILELVPIGIILICFSTAKSKSQLFKVAVIELMFIACIITIFCVFIHIMNITHEIKQIYIDFLFPRIAI